MDRALILAALACIGGFGAAPAQEISAADNETAALLEALVGNYHEAGLFDGVMLYAEDGNVETLQAYGLANHEHAAAIRPDTRFNIASVTKVFTATLVMKLVESGDIALDQTIGSFFPDLKPEVADTVTIEHLLRHRSGLTREFSEYFADSRDTANSIDDVIDRLNVAPLLFAPGERQSYSNANYILLADVVRRVSGVPYYAALRSTILVSADMRSTGLDHGAAIVEGRALGYSPTLVTESTRAMLSSARHSVLPGAGGLYTTAGDLLRFDRALRDGSILSDASLEKMYEPIDESGFAWEIHDTPAGRLALMTGAAREGFLSVFMRFLDRDATYILLTNNDAAGRSAFPRLAFSSIFAIAGATESVSLEPPSPQLRTLMETLLGDGEDAAVAYYESLNIEQPVKHNAGAMQATGAPDSWPGEASTAWASATPNDRVEWLDLRYDTGIRTRTVRVYQTQNPGAVSAIRTYDASGQERRQTIRDIREYVADNGLFVSEITLDRTALRNRIRLIVDAPGVPGWNQIDAVALVDGAGKEHWAVSADASSNEYATRDPDIFATPSEWALRKLAGTYYDYDRYDEAAKIAALAARLFPGASGVKALRDEAAKAAAGTKGLPSASGRPRPATR